MTIVLAVNAGSGSVKISVFAKTSDIQSLGEAEISNIKETPCKLKYSCHGSASSNDLHEEIKDQSDAFSYILERFLKDEDLSEVKNLSDIATVLHRIVHGGDFSKPQTINADTLETLETLTDLAPLHNSTALGIVRVCMEKLPDAKNIAVFDSQFHQTIPEHVRTIPINQKIAKKNKLRKYGFHGISYAFITASVATYLKKDTSDVNIIALHLGSGASGCAIQGGKSINTTMSLTPLDGLPGATRSGSVDPSLVFHYAANVGKLAPSSTHDLHISKAEEILNKESGWAALTGTTDFGRISERKTAETRLAFDIMVDRIAQVVGSYYVSLNGKCDALVFAGGMGEKATELRNAVVEKVACLGFSLLAEGTEVSDEVVTNLSRDASKIRVLVCKTDEARQMVVEAA